MFKFGSEQDRETRAAHDLRCIASVHQTPRHNRTTVHVRPSHDTYSLPKRPGRHSGTANGPGPQGLGNAVMASRNLADRPELELFQLPCAQTRVRAALPHQWPGLNVLFHYRSSERGQWSTPTPSPYHGGRCCPHRQHGAGVRGVVLLVRCTVAATWRRVQTQRTAHEPRISGEPGEMDQICRGEPYISTP